MDPVANIEEQRELAEAVIGDCLTDVELDFTATAVRLAELVLALDEWRQSGGFDPYNPPRPRYPLTRSV